MKQGSTEKVLVKSIKSKLPRDFNPKLKNSNLKNSDNKSQCWDVTKSIVKFIESFENLGSEWQIDKETNLNIEWYRCKLYGRIENQEASRNVSRLH